MNARVPFTGKYTDLIPDGWKWWPKGNCNHSQYYKEFNGGELQRLYIVKHEGGYLEVANSFDFTAVVVEAILSGSYQEKARLEPVFGFYCAMLDLKDSSFHSRGIEHTFVEPWDTRWRSCTLSVDLVAEIIKLKNKGWI